MNQVGEECNRAGEDKDRNLCPSSEHEHGKADRDGLDAFVRADYRAIDEPVRVTLLPMMVRLAFVPVFVRLERLRSVRTTKMPMRPCVSMSVNVVSVSVQYACVRSAHPQKR